MSPGLEGVAVCKKLGPGKAVPPGCQLLVFQTCPPCGLCALYFVVLQLATLVGGVCSWCGSHFGEPLVWSKAANRVW